jgi:hypothetical protein
MRSRVWHRCFRPVFLLAAALAVLSPAFATTVIPISDAELYNRADAVVYGVVVSTAVSESPNGDPQTVSVIEPIEVLKGGLPGNLVIRDAGGTLPDGRFFRLWGKAEYTIGREVVVFALARPEGDHTTAEMLLGKFDVMRDVKDARFAAAALSVKVPQGVEVRTTARSREAKSTTRGMLSTDGPRSLDSFLDFLRNGARGEQVSSRPPVGELRPVQRFDSGNITPDWANIGSLWRYNNGGNAGWTLDGSANITGGGSGEATRALATWTNDPTSTINHFIGGSNPIHLNAMTSSCGWNTCLTGGGVIGCGGPRGGGSHSWRNETYATITGGEVWLRCYASLNLFGSAITESVILHELGHALGLGHSDQAASSHDVCRGDESAAIMRSSVQNRTTLGTDDQDAIRWLYGDGANSCSSPPPPTCTPASITAQPTSRTITQGSSTTLSVSGGGTAPLSYQWYIGSSGSTSSPVSGATGTTLTISPGTTTSYWARVSNSCGSANSAAATVTVNQPTPPPATGVKGDFNGDGRADILWRNYSNGQNSIWFMNGTTLSQGVLIAPVGDGNWRIEGAADFNGDGRSDILWRNYSNGQNSIWLMNGTSIGQAVTLPSLPDVNWKFTGAADFNRDGHSDILLRHQSNGQNSVWLMNGPALTRGVLLPSVGDLNWRITGTADFNRDGRVDILWRNFANGQNSIWLMNDTSLSQGVLINPVADLNWTMTGAGDFDGDGSPEILWRHAISGQNSYWYMNGTALTSGVLIPSVGDRNWQVAGPR